MPFSIDKHLQSAKERPWVFSDPPVEPWFLPWSPTERLWFFMMGVGLPLVSYGLLTGFNPNWLPFVAQRLNFSFSEWWFVETIVFAADCWSGLCLTVCCVAPRNGARRWVQSGLYLGLISWLGWFLVVIYLAGAISGWFILSATVIALFLKIFTWTVTLFSIPGFRFSIWKIMCLTTAAALALTAYSLLPKLSFILWRYSLVLWWSIPLSVPLLASWAFARAVSDVYFKTRR